jgi:hypothetical protein
MRLDRHLQPVKYALVGLVSPPIVRAGEFYASEMNIGDVYDPLADTLDMASRNNAPELQARLSSLIAEQSFDQDTVC